MNLRFPGQYYDQESGLHYNYYRDYDPEVGRYVEGDPIGLAGGVNTSVYSVNNPQRFSDARGLEIVGEYFIYPRITIKKIQYRDWIDWGDPSWDPMSAWRIGWYHVRGEGVIDFIVHCIEYDECKNIKHEWFVDKAFDVAVEKTFEIRQNLAGAVTYAYKITEMKLEIEKMLKSKIAEYALDPTTWCIFSRIILAITK